MTAPVPSNQQNAHHALSTEAVRELATAAGFSDAGLIAVPHASDLRDAERFKDWIDAGRSGTMHYLARVNEEQQLVRAHVSTPFPWARSAIVCLASYHCAHPKSTDQAPSSTGWIARYAWSGRLDGEGKRRPSDYHKVLLRRLKALRAKLSERFGEFEARAYVDTGPVVERSLATAAGLGWTAKNTCLIHPKLGSFAFLGVILTSLEVTPVPEVLAVPDRCGTCRRCIEACPTDALIAPYQMDATRCISYLTIEHKGAIAPDLMRGMGRQIFGCDICQDVCPWNRKAPISSDSELDARPELVNPALQELAMMDEHSWEQLVNGSPMRRAGYSALRRNIAIAMGNSGELNFASLLRTWSESEDQDVRSAATWALTKLNEPESPEGQ